MTAHIRQFLDIIEPVHVIHDLPHVSLEATPDECEHVAWYVGKKLRRPIIEARAAIAKLNENLTVAKVDTDALDGILDLISNLEARADMIREQREGDR